MSGTDTRTGAPGPPGATPGFRNRWLEGPFAPVDQEVTVHDLKVTGSVPADLDGRLLRVGPEPVDPENPVTCNWFTGNGMVHGVRIRGGRAQWYRNRFVRDDEAARSDDPQDRGRAHPAARSSTTARSPSATPFSSTVPSPAGRRHVQVRLRQQPGPSGFDGNWIPDSELEEQRKVLGS